jgi:hypothetical protein
VLVEDDQVCAHAESWRRSTVAGANP